MFITLSFKFLYEALSYTIMKLELYPTKSKYETKRKSWTGSNTLGPKL